MTKFSINTSAETHDLILPILSKLRIIKINIDNSKTSGSSQNNKKNRSMLEQHLIVESNDLLQQGNTK